MKKVQPELPGMPADTELGKMGKKLASIVESIAEDKLQALALEKEMLSLMRSERIKRFKISVGADNYELKLVESSEHIRCAKITKQRRDHEKVDKKKED